MHKFGVVQFPGQAGPYLEDGTVPGLFKERAKRQVCLLGVSGWWSPTRDVGRRPRARGGVEDYYRYSTPPLRNTRPCLVDPSR